MKTNHAVSGPPLPGGETMDDSHQYLTFRIGGEVYAFGILKVKEILRYDTLTAVPSAPGSVRGVINLRGAVVPVVDLAVKFKLPPSQVTKWSCIIITEAAMEGERTVMGIMADAVNQVVELPPSEIEPPPPFGTRMKADYIVGMARSDKKFILILDVDKVLSAEELASGALVAEEAARAAEDAGEEPAKLQTEVAGSAATE